MKKVSIFISCFVVFFSITMYAQTSDWYMMGNRGLSQWSISSLNLEIDGTTPYIAYRDNGDYSLKVKKWNGAIWDFVGDSGYFEITPYNIGLTIHNSQPFIVYTDSDINYRATVAAFDGEYWYRVGDIGFTQGGASYPQITFDDESNPYIVFCDELNDYKLTVMKFENDQWQLVGNAGFNQGESYDFKLGFVNSNPYVIFAEKVDSIYYIGAMQYNGSTWDSLGSTEITMGEGERPSFTFNDAIPYVAFGEGTEMTRGTVLSFNGSTWETVGSTFFSTMSPIGTKIEFFENVPYVIYSEGESTKRFEIKKLVGNTWTSFAEDESEEPTAYSFALKFAPNGMPIVAYEDETLDSRLTVLQYSEYAGAPLPVELSSFTSTANGNHVVLAWSTATETNNVGWQIERSTGNQWKNIGFVSGKGTTTTAESYSFTDHDVAGKVQYRLKQIDNDGHYTYSNVLAFEVMPTSFDVLGNYPNPFNPSTTLRFTLPQTGKVRVVVSNVLGQQVAVVADREFNAGMIDLPFSAANLSSGMYYYTITANGKSVTKTMMLMK